MSQYRRVSTYPGEVFAGSDAVVIRIDPNITSVAPFLCRERDS